MYQIVISDTCYFTKIRIKVSYHMEEFCNEFSQPYI